MKNETPLIFLCSRAREDGHAELADKAERMAELLAKCAGELVALGSNRIVKEVHEELGYT
jgi:hypothetical protein